MFESAPIIRVCDKLNQKKKNEYKLFRFEIGMEMVDDGDEEK
jgi:hypothetical protein